MVLYGEKGYWNNRYTVWVNDLLMDFLSLPGSCEETRVTCFSIRGFAPSGHGSCWLLNVSNLLLILASILIFQIQRQRTIWMVPVLSQHSSTIDSWYPVCFIWNWSLPTMSRFRIDDQQSSRRKNFVQLPAFEGASQGTDLGMWKFAICLWRIQKSWRCTYFGWHWPDATLRSTLRVSLLQFHISVACLSFWFALIPKSCLRNMKCVWIGQWRICW